MVCINETMTTFRIISLIRKIISLKCISEFVQVQIIKKNLEKNSEAF